MIEVDPKAKALIFDLDGTVVDTMPIHYQAWIDILLEHGFDFSKELFHELAGIPSFKITRIINDRFGMNLNPDEISIRKEEAFLKKIDEIKPIKEVIDIIYKYYGKIPMALGTGGRKKIVEMTVKAMELDKYIDVVVTADDVENHKPAPDTFLKCAELMKVVPEFCQVFEDGEQGLEAAKRAGMIATDVRPYLKNK